jgi:hypothetical protein
MGTRSCGECENNIKQIDFNRNLFPPPMGYPAIISTTFRSGPAICSYQI